MNTKTDNGPLMGIFEPTLARSWITDGPLFFFLRKSQNFEATKYIKTDNGPLIGIF